MRSGNLVSGPGFAFIIHGDHSLIGGADYIMLITRNGTTMKVVPELQIYSIPSVVLAKQPGASIATLIFATKYFCS